MCGFLCRVCGADNTFDDLGVCLGLWYCCGVGIIQFLLRGLRTWRSFRCLNLVGRL